MSRAVGQVIKCIAGTFTVLADGSVLTAHGRKKVRQDGGEVLVGDFVEVEKTDGSYDATIEKVLPRKNRLIRPKVANVDLMIIVIAPSPKPDFFLVDKLLTSCIKDNIPTLICCNKIDIAKPRLIEQIKAEYSCFDTCFISSVTGEGFDEFKESLKGKTVCLSGQSAVGKSSLINQLLNLELKIGDLSKKTGRGRHTTREVEIFQADNFQIVDSCGFSAFEFEPIDPFKLSCFYPEFKNADCPYLGCTHTKEPECNIQSLIENGTITKGRYERYLRLYEFVKQKWEKQYE